MVPVITQVTLFCCFISADLAQQQPCDEEEILTEQERSSSLDQEKVEPLLIKEEQGEDESRLDLKQESSTVIVALTNRENLREPEQNLKQLLSRKPPVVEPTGQEGTKVGTESTNQAEPKTTCHRSKDHSVDGAATAERRSSVDTGEKPDYCRKALTRHRWGHVPSSRQVMSSEPLQRSWHQHVCKQIVSMENTSVITQ